MKMGITPAIGHSDIWVQIWLSPDIFTAVPNLYKFEVSKYQKL